MTAECSQRWFDFQPLGGREVTARFDGGTIAADGGALLLREVETRSRIVARFAECFDDFRDPEKTEFTVEELLKQRIFAICLGDETVRSPRTFGQRWGVVFYAAWAGAWSASNWVGA